MGQEEQLKLEHATLMEQFKAARDEINALLESSRQVVNLTFTAISLFLGISVFVETRLTIAYLILPIFLYGLTWVQLRHILLMRKSSAYIAQVIAPRVRKILQAVAPENPLETGHILNWEEGWQSPGRRKGGAWLLPVLGAGYGIPLLAAVLSLCAYFFSVAAIPPLEWVLIAVNVVGLAYSIVMGFLVEFWRLGQE